MNWQHSLPKKPTSRTRPANPSMSRSFAAARMIKRVRIEGCWYRTLDLAAGIRAYMGPRGAKRFWHGYYSGKAIDHFTGGVFRKCTTSGTAPVFPWRPGGGDFKRHDKDTHDRHGVPRCKHCGAPTSSPRRSPCRRSQFRARRR
jgi:hypothetical protein